MRESVQGWKEIVQCSLHYEGSGFAWGHRAIRSGLILAPMFFRRWWRDGSQHALISLDPNTHSFDRFLSWEQHTCVHCSACKLSKVIYRKIDSKGKPNESELQSTLFRIPIHTWSSILETTPSLLKSTCGADGRRCVSWAFKAASWACGRDERAEPVGESCIGLDMRELTWVLFELRIPGGR